MNNSSLTEKCNDILNFWKLEEYFTPSDYPKLLLKMKEGKKEIEFDAYYDVNSDKTLPLDRYISLIMSI